MKVNTAVGGILLAAAIGFLRRGNKASFPERVASAVFALGALAIGLATLAEYQLDLNFGIDELFFMDAGSIHNASPGGRPSPATALCFIFLAAAVLIGLLPAALRSKNKFSQGAAFLAFLLSFQGIVGYLIGFHYNFGKAYYAQIAVHAAVMINILSLAALSLFPTEGFVSVLSSTSVAGKSARRFILMTIVVVPVLSGLQMWGQRAGLFDDGLGTLLRVLGVVSLISAMTLRHAAELHRSEEKRGHAEDQLKLTNEIEAREARLRAILDSSFDAMVAMDESGIVTDWNPRAEKIFGWSKNEVIGREMADLIIPEETREAHRQGLQHFFASGESTVLNRTIEVIALRRSGDQFPVQLSVSPIRAGTTVHFTAFIADITDRKRAEAATAENNKRLSSIISAQFEVASLALDRSRLLTLVVERTAELTHASGAVIELIDGEELFYAGASGNAAKSLGFRLKLANSFSGLAISEGRALKCDDSEIDSRVNREACRQIGVRSMIVIPLKHETQTIGVLKAYSNKPYSFSADHVDTLQLMSGLLSLAMSQSSAFKAREEAVRSKSEFLANMSHEIRTPLNGILGMADLMDELCDQPMQRKYLRIIQESGNGLLSIINDILDFSKIEAGKLDIERIPFSVVTLVESQADLMAARAKEKNLSLMTFIDPAIVGNFSGDPGRIGQILLNLTSNAIKFTKDGFVTIKVAPLVGVKQGAQSTLRFSVTDSGVGLAKSDISRLFQPFTQADGSTARRFGGTGLGLSISRRLSELMGGTIGVESDLGRGSEFWFTVELDPVDAGVISEKSSRSIEPPLPEVLVFCQNKESTEILAKYLQNWGFHAHVGSSADEVLSLLNTSRFELVITDQDALNTISSERHSLMTNEAFSDVKKVVLGNFDREQTPEAFEMGKIVINTRLTRPVRQSELFDAIANLTRTVSIASESQSYVPGGKFKPEVRASLAARILVAEDNPVNQFLTLTILRKLGFVAEVVPDGRQAIEAYLRGGYDLILMDCQMSEMDGFEATRQIRNIEAKTGTRVPIVALTANAMREDEEKCLASGMDDHLSKPFKKDKLLARLEHWLKKSRAAA